MQELLQAFKEWYHENTALFGWLVSVSVATLIIAAIAVPVIVSRMSADYFMPDRDPGKALANQHPVLRWTGLIFKNLFGVILVVAGLVMLLTPGQGVLTVFIGLLLTDFPGKRRFEIWLFRIGALNRAVNWIRRKAGKEPLQLPDPD